MAIEFTKIKEEPRVSSHRTRFWNETTQIMRIQI
jgi:hypothetical protein